VGLYTELFYASIIPTLFLCFLLIGYPYILLHFLVEIRLCLAVGYGRLCTISTSSSIFLKQLEHVRLSNSVSYI